MVWNTQGPAARYLSFSAESVPLNTPIAHMWCVSFPHTLHGPRTTFKASSGRWKKLLPEVTKFEGIFTKLKSQPRSGWSEPMYVENTAKIYQERTKHPFEYLAALKGLRDKPKWTRKLTTSIHAGNKRKTGDGDLVARPEGQKAAKKKKARDDTNLPVDAHMRFVAASEKKADILEQQLHFSLFIQSPDSEESTEYFALRRKTFLAQLRAADREAAGCHNTRLADHEENRSGSRGTSDVIIAQGSIDQLLGSPQSSSDKENSPNTEASFRASAML
ncbi:uncharacterized protein PITG_18344 [Phytophthora infestans T30-4]|uniref:No apical meristem-associated C-terminal domain-containing protein n=1 Tax=Phytophthora infestans (strain T30-4) TaxID=403677 RepID=D0NXY1_PHYIT|nr:uncharacterized protein PITG_18344 [Phytophthora infestans T30-4]EEY67932.1 conserved hypothetical protein [Phytophthora infestans T30-4]|eukprot:XP_002997794.1 conserved hypothetical protein [Phytophthora infestans T30-4]